MFAFALQWTSVLSNLIPPRDRASNFALFRPLSVSLPQKLLNQTPQMSEMKFKGFLWQAGLICCLALTAVEQVISSERSPASSRVNTPPRMDFFFWKEKRGINEIYFFTKLLERLKA